MDILKIILSFPNEVIEKYSSFKDYMKMKPPLMYLVVMGKHAEPKDISNLTQYTLVVKRWKIIWKQKNQNHKSCSEIELGQV